MTLSELGNIGEFVGAVAVVVSLVYLAIQIRQNTQTVRATAYHNISAQWANHLQSIADNAELSSLYFRGLADSRSLDAQESVRFSLLMASQFGLLEDVFHQHILGTIEDDWFKSRRRAISLVLSSPGGRSWWVGNKHIFTHKFAHFVEEEFAQRSSAANKAL